MSYLLKFTIRTYIILGTILYVILFAYHAEESFSWYNALNVYSFICYAMMLWMSSNWSEDQYSYKNLGVTIFIYSVIFVTMYLTISDYYRGNTFIFSESDARLYEKWSFSLLETPFSEWIPSLTKKKIAYDDWGAPIAMALFLSILPSKIFINFCYILINTANGFLLFKIGKVIMSSRYAYIASLSYSISSYSLFFVGSFLKEIIMVFFVVASFYFLYMYFLHKNFHYMVIGGTVSLIVIFFRPPVALFIWLSYLLLFFLESKNSVIRYFVIFIALIAFVAALGLIQESSEKYANGGNVMESYSYTSTSTFQKLVIYVGTFIGPFPQLLQFDENITYKPLFGAGLLFKLLLFFAYWKGLWYALKSKHTIILPMYLFAVTEMLGLCLALDGIELRKVLPHVPLVILSAFWYLSVFDEGLESIGTNISEKIRTKKQFSLCVLIVICAVFVWNTMK